MFGKTKLICFLLGLTGMAAILGGIGVFAWAVFTPVGDLSPSDQALITDASNATENIDFKPIWNMKLQQSLEPVVIEKPAPPPPPPKSAPIQLLLVATFGNESAVFTVPGSPRQITAYVGNPIGDREITLISVASDHVLVGTAGATPQRVDLPGPTKP